MDTEIDALLRQGIQPPKDIDIDAFFIVPGVLYDHTIVPDQSTNVTKAGTYPIRGE